MQELAAIWQYLVAGVAAVVWFVRLEGSIKAVSEAVTRIQQQRHEDLNAATLNRAEANALLAEMRADIKTLLKESRDNK